MKPNDSQPIPEGSQEFNDAVVRLNKDLKAAVKTLTPHEARFLVDAYYAIQEYRKSSGNQVLALDKSEEPHEILNWLFNQQSTLEKQIGKTLDIWTDTQPVGQWCKSLCGIGPVITAGLIAHIDITRAPTAGRIWRLAGLTPTVKWYGKDGSEQLIKSILGPDHKKSVDDMDLALISKATDRSVESLEKLAKGKKTRMTLDNLQAGLARRPWNADLKTLCVEPSQRVTTRRGHIPICNIQVGDEVLTHKGRFRKVTEVLSRDYSGTLHQPRLFSHGNSGPWLTDEHPVFCTKMPVCHYQGDGRPRWKRGSVRRQKNYLKAEQIRGMVEAGVTQRDAAAAVGVSEAAASLYTHGRMGVPVISVGWEPISKVRPGWDLYVPRIPSETGPVFLYTSKEGMIPVEDQLAPEGRYPGSAHPRGKAVPARVEVTPGLAYVLGLYLAEGHSSGNRLGWSFHEKETEYANFVEHEIKETFGLTGHRSHNKKEHSMQVMFSSKALAKTFRNTFGRGAHAKHIPHDWISTLGDAPMRMLLKGIFDGDGHVDTGQARNLGIVSGELSWQVHDALVRLGEAASISKYPRHYVVREQKKDENTRKDESGVWHAVEGTEATPYVGPVFNLEVEEDHSYVVEGVAVHNCFKIGESFVKVSGRESDFYGKLFQQRKAKEWVNNLNGNFSDEVKRSLSAKKFGDATDAKAWLTGKISPQVAQWCLTRGIVSSSPTTESIAAMLKGDEVVDQALISAGFFDKENGPTDTYASAGAPMLPPAHIHARARRWIVKLFLSHYQYVAYRYQYGQDPPAPYATAKAGHADLIVPPNLPWKDFFGVPVK